MPADLDRHVPPLRIENVKVVVIHIRQRTLPLQVMFASHIPHRSLRTPHQNQEQALRNLGLGQVFFGQRVFVRFPSHVDYWKNWYFLAPGNRARPETLFEFRLRLLLGWLTDDSWPLPDDLSPTARNNWNDFDRPERCVLELARIGLGIKNISDLDQLIVALLREAHHQLGCVKRDAETRRNTLSLLMKYQPTSPTWRDLYAGVCLELDDLREKQLSEPRMESIDLSFAELSLILQSNLEWLDDIPYNQPALPD